MRSSFRIYLAGFLALLTVLSTLAKPNQQPAGQTIDGELRVLTVTVRNSAGNYVMGVPRDAFELTDEKEKRPIEFFENVDAPMSIGIVIDTSRSVQLSQVKESAIWKAIGDALSRFFQLSNTSNEYFLMSFDKSPRLLADWQNGQALLAQKVDIGPPGYATALYDGCFAAIEKLQSAHYSNRVLILISDGQDNLSKHTFNQLRDSLKDSELVMYGIGLTQGSDIGSSLGMEGAGIMEELAETTGGEARFAADERQLAKVVELLAVQLRHQYRIGFRVDKSGPAHKWHRLKLKVNSRPDAPKEFSKLTVRTRQGYYSH